MDKANKLKFIRRHRGVLTILRELPNNSLPNHSQNEHCSLESKVPQIEQDIPK
jgi:hypothetical protein